MTPEQSASHVQRVLAQVQVECIGYLIGILRNGEQAVVTCVFDFIAISANEWTARRSSDSAFPGNAKLRAYVLAIV